MRVSNDQLAELLSIKEASKSGRLHPEDVVIEAEDESSALHDNFEWDDEVAGHEYRIEQARHLIRVVARPLDVGGKAFSTRVFLRLPGETGYRTTVDVMTEPESRALALASALEELARVRVKYAHLQELAGVFSALDKIAA